MATSTFYKTITINDDSADILIKGLENPTAERPKVNANESLEMGKILLEQLLSNSKTSVKE